MGFGAFLQWCGRRDVARDVARDDDGVMLVEILVSAVSLVGMGLATFAVIDQASQASGTNRARAVATQLAQADLDQMRQMPYQELLDRSQAMREMTIDGRKYQVTSKLEFVDDSVGTSDCSSTSKSAKYLKLSSSVTSTGSSLSVPVVMETMRAPTLGTAGMGSVAIRLTTGAGGGTVGIPVIAGPNAASTNTNGCAFVDDVPESTDVTVSWNKAGYVNENGLTAVTANVAVRTDTTAVVTGNYDLAGSAVVNFTNKRIANPASITSGDRASWKTSSAVNQGITSVPVGKRRFTNASVANTMNQGTLFPFANDYGFYAGNCDGNNPELYKEATGVAGRINPGTATTVAVDLPAIAVTVRQGTTKRSGYRVYATPNTDPVSPEPNTTMEGCTERITRAGVTAGTNAGPVPAATDSNGLTSIPLPYGVWNICIDNNTSGSSARRYAVIFKNTPIGTDTPLNPTLVSGARAIDLNISTATATSSLCA